MSFSGATSPREDCRKCIGGPKSCKVFVCNGPDGQLTEIPSSPTQECSYCHHAYVAHVLPGPKDGTGASGILVRYGTDASECGGFVKKNSTEQLALQSECVCGLELGTHDRNPVNVASLAARSQITGLSTMTLGGASTTPFSNSGFPMNNQSMGQILAAYQQQQATFAGASSQSPVAQGPPIEAFRNPFAASPGSPSSDQTTASSANSRRMESSERHNARQNAPTIRVGTSGSTGKAGGKVKQPKSASAKGPTNAGKSNTVTGPLKLTVCLYPVSLVTSRMEDKIDDRIPRPLVSKDGDLSRIQHSLKEHFLTLTFEPCADGSELLWREVDSAISTISRNADVEVPRPANAGAVRDTSNTGWVPVSLVAKSAQRGKGKAAEGLLSLEAKVLTPGEFSLEGLLSKSFGAAMPNWSFGSSLVLFVCPRYGHLKGAIANFDSAIRGKSRAQMPTATHRCYPLRISQEMQLLDEDGEDVTAECSDNCVFFGDEMDAASRAPLTIRSPSPTPLRNDSKPVKAHSTDQPQAKKVKYELPQPMSPKSPSVEPYFPSTLSEFGRSVSTNAAVDNIPEKIKENPVPLFLLDNDDEDDESFQQAIAASIASLKSESNRVAASNSRVDSEPDAHRSRPTRRRQRDRSTSANPELRSPPRVKQKTAGESSIDPDIVCTGSSSMQSRELVYVSRLKSPILFKKPANTIDIVSWSKRVSSSVPDKKLGVRELNVAFKLSAKTLGDGVVALQLFIRAKILGWTEVQFTTELHASTKHHVEVTWVDSGYIFKDNRHFKLGNGVGSGVATSIIRGAVKSFVDDRRWCVQVGEYKTLLFHSSDEPPEERLIGFKVFGFLCALHMAVLRCGPDPISPHLLYLVVDGRNGFSLDMKFIGCLDSTFAQVLRPLSNWDGTGALAREPKTQVNVMLTQADVAVDTVSDQVSENERHGINVAVMSQMFLGVSNLESKAEFQAFRVGFNARLSSTKRLLDMFNPDETAKSILAAFYGRRLKTPQEVLKFLYFPNLQIIEVDSDSDVEASPTKGLDADADPPTRIAPPQYFELKFKEKMESYLVGIGHPDHSFVRAGVSAQEIEAEKKDKLLRALLFLKITTGSDLLPASNHKINFTFHHLPPDSVTPDNSVDAGEEKRPHIHFHVCFSQIEITLDDGFRELLVQSDGAFYEGEGASQFDGLIHSTMKSLEAGSFNSV